MLATILIFSTVFLLLGIGLIIYSISVAEEDSDLIEDNFDEKKFEKPEGWKVGKMPKNLPKSTVYVKKEVKNHKTTLSFIDLPFEFTQIKSHKIK